MSDVVDLLYARRSLLFQQHHGGGDDEGSLPPELTKAAYLECSGTQWIATDYVMTMSDNVRLDVDFAFTAEQGAESMLFGMNPGKSTQYKSFMQYYEGSWYCSTGMQSGIGKTDIGSLLNVRYQALVRNGHMTINGTGILNIYTDLSWKNPVTMYLFATHSSSGVARINNGMRLYGLKFTVNNAVEANFVPCVRKADGEPGIYDTVAKKFYTNSGTGNFIVGAN